MYKTDMVMLIGAGASIPAGVPGMAGMASGFAESLKAGSEELEAYRLLRDLGANEDVEELLQLANDIVELDVTNVGGFIEACISPRRCQTPLEAYRSRFSRYIKRMATFRTSLLSWITQSCLSFDRRKAEQLYGRLVQALSKRSIPVFTTNYDAVLDHVASSEKVDVVDNFVTNRFDRSFWDPTLSAIRRDGLRLIKMHGSIEWHATQDGRVEKIPQPADVNREGQPVERLVIFPTRFKDIFRQNFFPLYSSFNRTLGNAQTLIVIGHSLRDEYLLAAIRDQLRNPEFSLIVIDPVFKAKEQMSADLARAEDRVAHIPAGIEKVHPFVLQALCELPSQDLIATAREVAEKMRRNHSEKIEVLNIPAWVSRGEPVDIEVKIDTIVGGEEVRAWIERFKDPKDRIPLDLHEPLGSGEATSLLGRQNRTWSTRFTVPADLAGGSHKLVISLTDLAGRTAAKRAHGLRVKK